MICDYLIYALLHRKHKTIMASIIIHLITQIYDWIFYNFGLFHTLHFPFSIPYLHISDRNIFRKNLIVIQWLCICILHYRLLFITKTENKRILISDLTFNAIVYCFFVFVSIWLLLLQQLHNYTIFDIKINVDEASIHWILFVEIWNYWYDTLAIEYKKKDEIKTNCTLLVSMLKHIVYMIFLSLKNTYMHIFVFGFYH